MGDGARLALGLVLLFAAGWLGLASSVVWLEMLDQVDQKYPHGQRYGERFWYHQGHNVLADYKRFFPGGPLPRRAMVLGVTMFGVAAAGAFLLVGITGTLFFGVACVGTLCYFHFVR
jgi:hypothetical protein